MALVLAVSTFIFGDLAHAQDFFITSAISKAPTNLSKDPITVFTHVTTNTASTIIAATVLQANGIGTVLRLPPGASATVLEAIGIDYGSRSPSAIPLPAIIGGTVGGVVAILILAIVIWFRVRQRSAQRTIHPEQLANEPSGVSGYPGAASVGQYGSGDVTNTGGMAANQMTTSPWTIPPTTLGVNYSQSGLTSGPSFAYLSSSGVRGQRENQTWPAKATYVPPKARTPPPPPYSGSV